MFTAQDVAKLREQTGAGMMDCKKALTESAGDMAKAAEWLREHGVLKAAKKESRIAAEGIVDSYIHMGGKIGVLVEVNCESDFVARSDEFKALVHDIAMQIAAANPSYVNQADVPQTEVDKETEILKAQIANEGKPVKPEILDKMVTGKIGKFYKQVCLMEQEFVKDNSLTITQLVTNAIAKIGEKISVRRFVRFEMGEGLEKKTENLQDAINQLTKNK